MDLPMPTTITRASGVLHKIVGADQALTVLNKWRVDLFGHCNWAPIEVMRKRHTIVIDLSSV